MKGQNFGYCSPTQFAQVGVASLLTMLAHMLGQQTGGPQLLSIAQILGFLTRQVHDPGLILFRHAHRATPAGQVAQGYQHPQLQGFGEAPFDFGPVGVESRSNGRDRLPLGITEQNLSALNAGPRLGSGLREAAEKSLIFVGQAQFGASAYKGHRHSPPADRMSISLHNEIGNCNII